MPQSNVIETETVMLFGFNLPIRKPTIFPSSTIVSLLPHGFAVARSTSALKMSLPNTAIFGYDVKGKLGRKSQKLRLFGPEQLLEIASQKLTAINLNDVVL